MARNKKAKKAKKPLRTARDIQTPISDRADTVDHVSEVQRRYRLKADRSPTRKEDFAPGQIGDSYESHDETDVDC